MQSDELPNALISADAAIRLIAFGDEEVGSDLVGALLRDYGGDPLELVPADQWPRRIEAQRRRYFPAEEDDARAEAVRRLISGYPERVAALRQTLAALTQARDSLMTHVRADRIPLLYNDGSKVGLPDIHDLGLNVDLDGRLEQVDLNCPREPWEAVRTRHKRTYRRADGQIVNEVRLMFVRATIKELIRTQAGKPETSEESSHVVRLEPVITTKRQRKTNGLDYRGLDKPLAEEMHALITCGRASSAENAARFVYKKAAGYPHTQEASIVKRLALHYRQTYPDTKKE